jgi:F-type H+-transporting ATPase subunit b
VNPLPAFRRSHRVGVLILPSLFCVAPALARAAEEHAAEGHHGPDWFTLGIAALNFAALLFVLRRYALPLVQAFFFQRAEAIRKQLDESQSRLRAAEAELEDLRRRLRRLDEDARAMVAQMAEQASGERDRAMQRAEQATQRIREDARRVADRELERARTALRSEAAALASAIAAQILREQVRPEDHERLIEEFMNRVEASPS